MMKRNGYFTSWSQILQALEFGYGSSAYDDPGYALFNLYQESTVTHYYDTFIALANRMEGMPTKSLLTCFISGLKPDIHPIEA